MATITCSYGLDNSATFNGDTVSDILGSSRLRQFLGFSDNVEAVIDGVVVDGSHELDEGDTVTLRARAGNKGAASVSVSYGLDNEITLAVTNVGEILANARARQYLGFSDNVEAVVNGVVVGRDHNLMNGDTVTLRAKAGNKGC
jgi:molybdopterin converting factor small subunit